MTPFRQELLQDIAAIGRDVRDDYKPELRKLWLAVRDARDLRHTKCLFSVAALRVGGPQGCRLRELGLSIPLDGVDL